MTGPGGVEVQFAREEPPGLALKVPVGQNAQLRDDCPARGLYVPRSHSRRAPPVQYDPDGQPWQPLLCEMRTHGVRGPRARLITRTLNICMVNGVPLVAVIRIIMIRALLVVVVIRTYPFVQLVARNLSPAKHVPTI